MPKDTAEMPDTGETISKPDGAATRPRLPPVNRRRNLLLALTGVVVVGAIGYGAYWFLFASHFVSTDNAYTGADVAQVTPLISGQVLSIPVVETQFVKAGQPVLYIDPADEKIAVAQAKAALGQAERQVKGYFANDTALAAEVVSRRSAIAQADAQIAGATSDRDRALIDLQRRQRLASSGAVSGEELTTAQDRFKEAQAALTAAQAAHASAIANASQAAGSRGVNEALIVGTDVANNPDVLAARARLDAAELALSRTVIPAPVSGEVTKKVAEIGQQVQPGTVVMQIVPVREIYVDANFKEVQLKRVRIGQPVVLTSDLYGGGVKFHGRVRGLSGGTGSAFSLIPAQNASGNWIKIVQRLPVRITLDPDELEKHPLRVGLSMNATVNVASSR
ncbi:MAG TPA: HlyD family secretion protein [Caulobacteraceae bacterium]|jgi:membrane fusion protein (multidrug efflux system)